MVLYIRSKLNPATGTQKSIWAKTFADCWKVVILVLGIQPVCDNREMPLIKALHTRRCYKFVKGIFTGYRMFLNFRAVHKPPV